MSKGQTLLCLVKERLALAAEDIFVLFERTIAEYEEELCRSKEENQRNQQLLEQLLSRWNVQSPSPQPGLSLKLTGVQHEPEEQRVKQEDEQLPVPVPECSGVSVKSEEASHRDREDISSGSDTGHTDNDEHCCSAPHLTETENSTQVYSTDTSSTRSPHHRTSAESAPYSGADLAEAEDKKHQCPFCQKRFGTKQTLKTHIRVHTGEKPFGCPVCKKNFTQKSSLNLHLRIHTGEKPFCCSYCNKTFAQKCNLKTHMITHQGSKFPPQNMFGHSGLTEGT